MEELQQYDIIEIIKSDSVHIIGSFHSLVDGEIILFVPPLIQHVLKSEVTNVSRLKRKDEYDTSKIEMFFKYSSFIFQKRYKIHDVLTITFDDDEVIEAKITEIVDDCLTLQLETQEYIYINFNYKSSIPLGILEITRKPLDDFDEDQEENNYSVVTYNIDETKCRYTLEIQLNALVQYLNFTKKYDGELFAQRYKELITIFPYGNVLKLDQSELKWILPVTDANIQITNNDAFKHHLTTTLMYYKKGLLKNKDIAYNIVQTMYNAKLRVFDKLYPYRPNHIQSYIIPETVILKFEAKTASKTLETNWVKKNQNWISYVTDEVLPITGYTALPPSSISFSKYYLPETSLVQKTHLNLFSHYHLFNIHCEPSFSFKSNESSTLIPTLSQLVQKPLLNTFSVYDFIHALEPYNIYHNNIPYIHLSKIQSTIAKNIKLFTKKNSSVIQESTPLSTNELYHKTYLTTSELYAYALSQDSANVYLLSLLPSRAPIDPLKKPEEPKKADVETNFVMKPSEPECELDNNCDEKNGPKKMKNFSLSIYHSSAEPIENKMDTSLLEKKIKYNKNQQLKYNNQFNEYSSGIVHTERLAPTVELFYQIMAYPLTKRYTTLLQFITKYTTLDKDTQIFVCNTSNIPLVPYFFKMIAETYLTDIDEYHMKVYDYCRSSQQIYIEDGFYKDKVTGLSLAPIENVNSYDEMIRSAQIELDEAAPLQFTEAQQMIQNHIQMIWREITHKPQLTKHTLSVFINDMLSQYDLSKEIKTNYLLTLLIYVFIQTGIPCDKIPEEIAKNKKILEINLGFSEKPSFSFLSSLQKIIPTINSLCSKMQTKYNKTDQKLKLIRQRIPTEDEAEKVQFMPYPDSSYPTLMHIKASIQKNAPIHSLNGEIKRVNHAFIDLAPPEKYTLTFPFHSYVIKTEFPPKPDIELHFDIHPSIVQPKQYPAMQSYITSKTIDVMNREYQPLKSMNKHLHEQTINDMLRKYPPLYFANYIKTILQFYSVLNNNNELQDDFIPVTHKELIAPSHKDTIDKFLKKYYDDFIYQQWDIDNVKQILHELTQSLPDSESIKQILRYYLFSVCQNLNPNVQQFVNKKLKSELTIPDYSEIKKKMTIRQSIERQNFVHNSKKLEPIEKSLKSILQTEITKTSYNIAQFISREEDAMKADNPDGDDGNE